MAKDTEVVDISEIPVWPECFGSTYDWTCRLVSMEHIFVMVDESFKGHYYVFLRIILDKRRCSIHTRILTHINVPPPHTKATPMSTRKIPPDKFRD